MSAEVAHELIVQVARGAIIGTLLFALALLVAWLWQR